MKNFEPHEARAVTLDMFDIIIIFWGILIMITIFYKKVG